MRQTLLFYNLNSIFMKKLYLFAALAAMLAACSENDLTVNEQPSKTAETIEDAVNFDVYVGRGLTRGGVNGAVTTTNLKDEGGTSAHNKQGFGVFGYYTDGEPYSAITKPNFFYNQQVKYKSANWTYEPVKYWPNEFGGDAKSDQLDRLTLFAYLPFVEVDPLTGVTKPATETELAAVGDAAAKEVLKKEKDPTTNIIGMTRNTATGDPFIKYVSTMDPKNSVDLCYGVAAREFTSSNSSVNRNDIAKGKPYIDVVKPGTDANSKIFFDFKHATAQLQVTINADVNDQTNGSPETQVQADYTRIWVRSVTFTGVTQKGSLSLNSTEDSPEWYDINGTSKITSGSLTVYDGRKDGKEANDAASNETPATLNPDIVQSMPYSINKSTGEIEATVGGKTFPNGVKKDVINLFNGTYTSGTPDVIQPVFVIPTKEKMRVTIVYDVETVDPNLPYYLSDGNTPGSTIQNTIYKDIDAFGEITAGYCYTLKLHLGMRTVDFEAEVTDWKDMMADVDLPSNLQTFIANSPQTNATVKIGNEATEYSFAVSDLIPGKTITPTITAGAAGSVVATPSSVTVNSAGIAECTISTTGSPATNLTPNDKDWGKIKFYDDSKAAELTIIQLASPLGLHATALNDGENTITLSATKATGTTATDWNNAESSLIIKRNATTITPTSFTDGVITLPANAQSEDIYTITIKVGDAPQETVIVNVP